jgi:hypothetical protein
MCAFETRVGRGFASFPLCLALGLTVALQASAVTRQSPEQQNAIASPSSGKDATPQTAPSVEVINGTSRTITNFNSNSNTARPTGVRRHARAASAGTSVEVINGSRERTVVLKAEPSSTSVRNNAHSNVARHSRRKRAAATYKASRADITLPNQKHPASGQVTERRNLPPNVIGIASSDSKSQQEKSKPVVVGILSSGSEHGASNAQPVVVGIASSASQGPEGNAHPVVIGIASSGAQAQRAAQPVAVAVAPRPAKRRPYRPAAFDAQ